LLRLFGRIFGQIKITLLTTTTDQQNTEKNGDPTGFHVFIPDF
jgi:hypothetical protein